MADLLKISGLLMSFLLQSYDLLLFHNEIFGRNMLQNLSQGGVTWFNLATGMQLPCWGLLIGSSGNCAAAKLFLSPAKVQKAVCNIRNLERKRMNLGQDFRKVCIMLKFVSGVIISLRLYCIMHTKKGRGEEIVNALQFLRSWLFSGPCISDY